MPRCPLFCALKAHVEQPLGTGRIWWREGLLVSPPKLWNTTNEIEYNILNDTRQDLGHLFVQELFSHGHLVQGKAQGQSTALAL